MIQCDFVASRRSLLSKQVKMAASYCYCPSFPAEVWSGVGNLFCSVQQFGLF